MELLRDAGLVVPDAAVLKGLREVAWPARLEVVRDRPLVILDCAHNVASAEALVEVLATTFRRPGPVRLVFAAAADKPVAGMLAVLAPHVTHVYATRFADNPRGLPPERVAELLAGTGVAVAVEAAAPAALRRALDDAGGEGTVVVTGSVFLAGELRPALVG